MNAPLDPNGPIYLDYNATTPVDPRVAEAADAALREAWGNPSSAHPYGARALDRLEGARRQLAELLGAGPDEIVFTGGGSESDNLAIKGIVFAARGRGNHVVTSAVEHPAVLATCRWIVDRLGGRLTLLPVDGTGRVDPGDVAGAIEPSTVLVTVMHANNEVGTLNPIAEIARVCRERGVVFHTDAAQSVGKVPIRVDDRVPGAGYPHPSFGRVPDPAAGYPAGTGASRVPGAGCPLAGGAGRGGV
ncbi:MAG TPA: aminotransferase class V-fold PLP-dependent enzyme, partial [Chloroflexota bacterium]|nr:aminotransferase class V-fold PLP-dependent enzyme [Chloroflexota bacterium]